MSQPSKPLTTNDPRLGDKARTSEILISIFLPLSTIAVVLRLYVRFARHAMLAADDYLAILAYSIWVVWAGMCLWAGRNGGGWPATSLPLHYNEIQAKVLYVAPILSASIATAAKFSILTLYQRVFRPNRSFRIQSWIVGTSCFLWWLSAVLVTIFQCVPIRAGWNVITRLDSSTRCVDYQKLFFGFGVPGAILDYAVAAMAIHIVRHLQMNMAHKIGLVVLFLLCTVVAFLGLFRIGITYRPANYVVWQQFEWLSVQNAFFIICCCLPTYGPFITKVGVPVRNLTGFFRGLNGHLRMSHSGSQSQAIRLPDEHTDQRDELGSRAKDDRLQSNTTTLDARRSLRGIKQSTPLEVVEV